MSTTNTSNTTEAKAQFTPGPWVAMPFGRDAESRLGGATVYGPDNCRVAEVLYSRIQAVKRRTEEEHKANARLIAECPAMLAALQGCAAALVEAGKDFALSNPYAARPNLYELHAEQAFRVIARATGQSGKAGAL